MAGTVTDGELLAYYQQPLFQELRPPWLELVDGTAITSMGITPAGQTQLADLAVTAAARLRGGRVAMLAGSDVVYGMFRMWELQREGLGYAVRVFRSFDEARAWLLVGPG